MKGDLKNYFLASVGAGRTFVVEYTKGGKKCSTRVYRGIEAARQVAQQRKSEFGGSVCIIGFDSAGHRTLEQLV